MSNNPFFEKSGLNPFASSSADGGMQSSTFSKYGKLSLAAKVPCTRCKAEHTPVSEKIRQHNRAQLTRLLCKDCTERDNELICACAAYIVAKGGFPPTIEQLIESTIVRDESLSRETEDPFEKVREKYRRDPLQEEDIAHWINDKLFVLNKARGQLECHIDRVLDDPARALLLGKAGLEGKQMAAAKAKRLAIEKQNPQDKPFR